MCELQKNSKIVFIYVVYVFVITKKKKHQQSHNLLLFYNCIVYIFRTGIKHNTYTFIYTIFNKIKFIHKFNNKQKIYIVYSLI